jgi:hypothetical protein
MAGQGQVRAVISAAVLLRNDVFDVKPEELMCLLWKVAVLAPVVRSGSDSPSSGGVDHEEECWAKSFRAFAWRIAMKRLTRI